MFSTLIVARMNPSAATDVAGIFEEFDGGDMPYRMGTQRRELFKFHDLYFHLQDFTRPNGDDEVEAAKSDPRFVNVSSDLRPFISAYDPAWRSPRDAMAERFYHWEARP